MNNRYPSKSLVIRKYTGTLIDIYQTRADGIPPVINTDIRTCFCVALYMDQCPIGTATEARNERPRLAGFRLRARPNGYYNLMTISNTVRPRHPIFFSALGAHEYGTTAPTLGTRTLQPSCLVVLVRCLLLLLIVFDRLGSWCGFGFLSRLRASVWLVFLVCWIFWSIRVSSRNSM